MPIWVPGGPASCRFRHSLIASVPTFSSRRFSLLNRIKLYPRYDAKNPRKTDLNLALRKDFCPSDQRFRRDNSRVSKSSRGTRFFRNSNFTGCRLWYSDNQNRETGNLGTGFASHTMAPRCTRFLQKFNHTVTNAAENTYSHVKLGPR